MNAHCSKVHQPPPQDGQSQSIKEVCLTGPVQHQRSRRSGSFSSPALLGELEQAISLLPFIFDRNKMFCTSLQRPAFVFNERSPEAASSTWYGSDFGKMKTYGSYCISENTSPLWVSHPLSHSRDTTTPTPRLSLPRRPLQDSSGQGHTHAETCLPPCHAFWQDRAPTVPNQHGSSCLTATTK